MKKYYIAASFEALRAQADAACSYMHSKIAVAGPVADGTSDQVYFRSTAPDTEHFDAVSSTTMSETLSGPTMLTPIARSVGCLTSAGGATALRRLGQIELKPR